MKSIFSTKATSQSHAGMNLATARESKTQSLYEEMGGTYTLDADGMYYPDLALPEEEPWQVRQNASALSNAAATARSSFSISSQSSTPSS